MELNELKKLILSGEVYYENDPLFKEIHEEQRMYNTLLHQFNLIQPNDLKGKRECLEKLLGQIGEEVTITQPLNANWGKNTFLGDRVYANSNLTLVDDAKIFIGDDTMIGPNVTITSASHPLNPADRLKKGQYNKEVTIGKNVWMGANVIIFPGVTVGDNTVIGAGSIVTKDLPANVLAFGSPCKVIQSI